MAQIGVREHPVVNIDRALVCESAAPIPMSEVVTPFSAKTEAYVWQGTLNFFVSVSFCLEAKFMEENNAFFKFPFK